MLAGNWEYIFCTKTRNFSVINSNKLRRRHDAISVIRRKVSFTIWRYVEDLSLHHSERGQGLGLKTCSFEPQGVPGPSILLSVFPYPAIPEVGTGRPASVGKSQ
jgi:hypothetical protein